MGHLIQRLLMRANRWHFVHSYRALIAREIKKYPGDRDRALMASVGAVSPEEFARQGDDHVAVLRHNGLHDGMTIYDLGCGCGRTALALRRSGWHGRYKGADIVPTLIDHLRSK